MYKLVIKFAKSLVEGKLIKRYKIYFTEVLLNKEVVIANYPDAESMKDLLNKVTVSIYFLKLFVL